jgi:hypothetical protein
MRNLASTLRVLLATPQIAIGRHQNGHLANCHAFGCTADRFPNRKLGKSAIFQMAIGMCVFGWPKWPLVERPLIMWRQMAVLEMAILNSYLSQTHSK